MPSKSNKKYTTVSCDVLWVGDKSIKIFSAHTGDEYYIPISLIENGESVVEEDDVDINIEEWKAKQEGLD